LFSSSSTSEIIESFLLSSGSLTRSNNECFSFVDEKTLSYIASQSDNLSGLLSGISISLGGLSIKSSLYKMYGDLWSDPLKL
jgi:hypothetical protein